MYRYDIYNLHDELKGRAAVGSTRGFGTGGFGRGGFGAPLNTEALNESIAIQPMSPETPLVLRVAEATEPLPVPPEPSASTSPSTVQASARSMATVSGRASPTMTVAPASAEPTSAERTVVLEQRLSERPEDIRDAARVLSKAITDQIDFLNASKPNDGDALARHDDLIAFLTQIAERLIGLADAIDAAINASSSERAPVLLGTSARVARSIGDFVNEGVRTHRAALQACAIKFPVIAGCASLAHTLGVDPTIAFGVIAAIMGVKSDSKKE